MPTYFTDLRHTLAGQTLRTWETVDQSPHVGRRMRMRHLEVWILDTDGSAGRAPESRGYTSQEAAEAAAVEIMDGYDGRGIQQEWREVTS